MTDEQQWSRLKNEYYTHVLNLLNFLQTLSTEDLADAGTVKKLIEMRHHVTDAYLHVFIFIDDASLVSFRKMLSEATAKDR